MKKYKQIWVTPETHKQAKKKAAEQGLTLDQAIAKALGKNAEDNKKKVKQYGLFK